MIASDGLSLVGNWVHPSQRAAQVPKTAVLYGREWSAADAAYAEALAADESIPTADLVRLWAEERPSVRVTPSPLVNGSPVTEIGGSVTPERDTDAQRRRDRDAERQRRHRERKRGT
jgi:hypothetical protein